MKLNIPNPCDANWELMQIKMHSRHCSLCQKEVMDFTKMSRAEIVVYLLNQPKGSVCGRMRPDQFDFYEEDLPELLQIISRPAYAKNAMMILALICLSLSSCENQTATPKKTNPNRIEQPQKMGKVEKIENPKTDSKKSTGKVSKMNKIQEPIVQGEIIDVNTCKPSIEGNIVLEYTLTPNLDPKKKEDWIEEYPDTEAEFPGGIKELLRFININLEYPQDMFFNKVEGKIFMEFIVEKDGSVSNVKVIKGLDGYQSMEKESLRIIQAMPKWKPAKSNHELVRSKLRIPIVFKLS